MHAPIPTLQPSRMANPMPVGTAAALEAPMAEVCIGRPREPIAGVRAGKAGIATQRIATQRIATKRIATKRKARAQRVAASQLLQSISLVPPPSARARNLRAST